MYTLALAYAPLPLGIASSTVRREGVARVHGPAWPAWLLVALCAATGAYCLLRMRSGVEEQRSAAGGEALMGFGMAAMAVPATVFSPPGWAWPLYAAVFAAAALRAVWAARAGPHHLHHLVGTGAMVYMSLTMELSPTAHHHAHAATGVPLVTGVLLIYFTGYVLLSGARLVPCAVAAGGTGTAAGGTGTGGTAAGGTAAVRWGDRPELARACRLSMGIGMVAMLLAL